jgi:rfaE bifunctional protein kinase chain/domain
MTESMRDRLLRIIDKFPGRMLTVVGDLIADEFLYAQISRVSREAPVLVLDHKDLVSVPGGAANAANNLLDMACKVRVVGVVGKDAAGRSLFRALARKGADTRHLGQARAYTTPVKTRILAGAHHSVSQQVVRIDRVPELDANQNHPERSLKASLGPCDGIILSDYGYGMAAPSVLSHARLVAKRKRIPLVVDSRFRMQEYTEVTAITPNITELEAAVGRTIGADEGLLREVAARVIRKQRLRYLLVTQGRFGMTLFEKGSSPVRIPIFGSDEVADVTGAGDTVIAVFTLALASGASAEEAARLANYAGGLVVMKRGTATATRSELRAAVEQDLSS